MKEILITSSVLILSVIILRLLFRTTVSRRLIYGAWLLVALRLLVPIQFGQLNISILNQTEPVTDAITDIAQRPVSGPSREELYNDALREQISQGGPVFIPEVQEQAESQIQHSGRPAEDVYEEILGSNKPEAIILPEVNQQIETVVEETISPTLGQIALGIWIIGMVAMAAWFLGVNLSFRRSLRSATESPEPGCQTPVKVSTAIASPCVFGLLRPVIYLTPNCVENMRIRRHVLTHEQTHLRHGDHIWAWVRCILLCLYWFHPLVWIAAILSKRDCELACDEAALKTLGEGERLAYGKTLVDMVSSVPAPGQLLETATAMHETKKQIKERVKCIVKKPKVFLTAAIALLLVLTIVTGCAFSGPVAKLAEQPTDTTTPTTDATTPTAEATTPTAEATTPTAEATAPTTEGNTPPTTEVTPPITEPQNPTNPPQEAPLAEIPVITETATLPNNPSVDDLLLDPYTGSAQWYDTLDNYFTVDIELPLLVPFCDGAKAINEAIRNEYQWRIDQANHNYLHGYSEFEKTISYEAYLNGNVLSIIITRDGNLDHNGYHTYNLDISTGKQLSICDMAQRFAGASYPEFLMHATYTAYDYLYHFYESKGSIPQRLFDDFEHDTITMQDYKLALDADSTLILYNGYNSTFMRTVVVPFDPTAHKAEFSDGEKDAYQWLFTRNADSAFSTYLGSFLANSFFLDPESFLRYLSEMDDTTIQDIAGQIANDLQPEEFDSFNTLCDQHLSNNATVKAAKALLDTFDKAH